MFYRGGFVTLHVPVINYQRSLKNSDDKKHAKFTRVRAVAVNTKENYNLFMMYVSRSG